MYTCQFCVANGGDPQALTFTSDPTWLQHLVSEEHFSVQRMRGAKKTFANWDQKRTVVVSGIFGLKAKELVEYFATFGDLQNFFYVSKEDGRAQFCKVLMADEKSGRAIHLAGHHTVNNTTFQVRLQLEAAVKGPPPSVMPATSAASSSSATSVSATSTSPGGLHPSEKFKSLHGKPEGGYSSGTGFSCRVCDDAGSNGIKGEEKWVQHLISDSHQNVHRMNQHLRKLLWDLDKTIMVSKAKGVGSGHILRYLVAFGGTVVDFSYLAAKDGGTDVCYALMTSKEDASKLTISESHCIGPQRKNVRISLITANQKLKWGKWKNKLIAALESTTENMLKFDESFAMDEDAATVDECGGEGDLEIQEVIQKLNDVTDSTNKRKSTHLDNKLQSFKGLSIAEQLDKCREMFGWSDDFLQNGVKFVNYIVGKTNLKPKKVPFGDFTTGLGLETSPTLQLMVDVQEFMEPKQNKGAISSMSNSCFRSLEQLKLKSKGPFSITKISTTESEICVSSYVQKVETTLKLRFSNCLPVQECRLFKFYCDFDARIFPMTFLLGFWATSNNFLQNSKQSFPNQLIVLMVLFYLQHKKVIPTVQKLQESICEDTKPLLINGNNVDFCDQIDVVTKLHPNPLTTLLKDESIRAMSTMGLLKDWFQFFATADLKENGICSRFGYFIPKRDFQPDSVGQLPGDLCRVYRFGMTSSEHKQSDSVNMKKFLCSQTPLCVQHPFDLSMNCSRGITPHEIAKFQIGCKEATEVLSNLLTSDNPDFTEFLSKCVPVFSGFEESACKKLKTEEGPVQSAPTSSSSASLSVSSASASSSSVKATSLTKPDIKSSPPLSSPTKTNVTDHRPRAAAADFFTKNPDTTYNKPAEKDADDDENESDFTMDTDVDAMSVISDSSTRDCTITLNKNLFDYFARTCAGTEAMKFEKLQLLLLQYILEFNQKFWVNCLGLIFEPKVGQKFWPEEFAKIFHEGKMKTDKTMLQKILAIKDMDQDLNVTFRVRSDGKIIHKMFVDSPDTALVSKWCKGMPLTEFSLQLYEEVPESRLTEIKNSVYAQADLNKTDQQILLECQLLGAVSTTRTFPTPLVTLNIGAVKYGHARIDALKNLYRTLCMSYINKMIKRWIAEASDFDINKASNFVQGRNQKWKAKANKKGKNKVKKEQRRNQFQNPNKIPVVVPPRSNASGQPVVRPHSFNPPSQFYSSPQALQALQVPQQSFRAQRPMSLGRGSRYPGMQPMGQQPTFSMGRGRPPYPDQFQQQQHQFYESSSQSYDPPPERLLRNPGPQGMRTFYPPHLQPSAPQSVPLLPNPQFNVSHNLISHPQIIHDVEDYPNCPLPSFQSQGQSHLGPPPIFNTNNNSPHQSSFSGSLNHSIPQTFTQDFDSQDRMMYYPEQNEINAPNLHYRHSPSSELKPLPQFVPNPHHQPQPLFPNPRHHIESPPAPLLPNPYFRNGHVGPNPEDEARRERFESFVQRGQKQNASLAEQISYNLSPQSKFENTYSRREPIRRSCNNSFEYSPPKPRPLFEPKFPNSNQAFSSNGLNQPQPLFPSDNRHQQRPLFDSRSPRNAVPQFQPQIRNKCPPKPLFDSRMDTEHFSVRPKAPHKKNQTHYESSRPSQPMNRAFVQGGYLSTEKVEDSDDDDLDIVYEFDPKGRTSPLPSPPQKQFKIGAPFPVPSKPSVLRARSPLSTVSRNSMGYVTINEREGYMTAPDGSCANSDRDGRNSTDSVSRGVFVSFNDFQGFGINPSGGISSQAYSVGRRF